MTGQLAGRLGDRRVGNAPNRRTGKDRRQFHLESIDSMEGDMGICFSWGWRMGKLTQGSLGKRGSPFHCVFFPLRTEESPSEWGRGGEASLPQAAEGS